MNQHDGAWTEQRVKTLRDMWGKFSPAVIAERLSTTRNAVIGKADRIGLRGEGSRLASQKHGRLPPEEAARRRKEREAARAEKRRLIAAAKPKPAPSLPLAVLPRKRQPPAIVYTGTPVTLAKIVAGQCRWILNDDRRGAESLCCGDSVAGIGHVYCTAHQARARGVRTGSLDGLSGIDLSAARQGTRVA